MIRAKFWIRKDRENYFLSGVIIACVIGAFVSSYWHFTDRISVRKKIEIKQQAPEEIEAVKQRKLRDLQFTPSKTRIGATQYYRMDAPVVPAVPLPGEE